MGKREASMFAAQLEGVDLDAPRAKRHKAAASSPVAIKDEPGPANGTLDAGPSAQDAKDDPETVKEKGLKLWQAVKDAVNKEGRVMSVDFLRLPSKRLYADYYDLIKKPIALDDIKRQLEHGGYATFSEVKQDFEQCFRNAKRYNVKESQIWRDAKHLHKLVLKESNKLTGSNESVDVGDDHDGNGAEGSDAEGEGKKKKPPNMTRLLKTRLQKLVDKTDEDGRMLSAEFMELPSKKLWPMYYKQIKRPQCIENVFKHLKRKEYTTSLDFANDVELVFSNALEFNMEHTPIWEDAIVLRDYFRQLMSDLPAPYSIPAYASPDHSTKIKLKMPTATHPASVVTAGASGAAGPSQVTPTASPKLRLPATATAAAAAAQGSGAMASTSTAVSIPSAAAASTPKITSAVPTPVIQTMQYSTPTVTKPVISVQAATYGQQSYYSEQNQQAARASYRALATPSLPNTNNIHVNPGRVNTRAHHVSHSPVVPAAVPQSSRQPPPVKIPNQIPPSLLAAKSPTPVTMQNRRQLRSVSVTTKPFGRRIDMDHKDGVRIWSARLGPGETGIRISDVKFLSLKGDEDESSDEEDHKDKDKARDDDKDKDQDKTQPEAEAEPTSGAAERHEEEEEEPEDAHEQPQEKPQKRGRGRPRKRPKAAVKPAADESPKGKGKAKVAEAPQEEEEVQVRWNSTVVAPLQAESEKGREAWEVALILGMNTVEVGEKGGVVWRMYLDRTVV
ncbi:hypothetical protein EIP86_007753 [Pleurotus ostreatoroseus]|nr:hypothetical protein EIP86_007753 [Pleurotus ostreatoroseus]